MAYKRKRQASGTLAKKRKTKQPTASSRAPISSESTKTAVLQDSKLLALPSELLAHILSFLLVRDDGRPVTLRSAKDRRWRNEISNLTDIEWTPANLPRYYLDHYTVVAPVSKSDLLKTLLVSRDFYFAGVAAFFGGNILKFDSTASLAQLAKKLDVDRRRHIASVMIERDIQAIGLDGPEPRKADGAHEPEALHAAMQKLPALKEVILDFKIGGSARRVFSWDGLRAHMIVLREHFDEAPVRISFAVDDTLTDLETRKTLMG